MEGDILHSFVECLRAAGLEVEAVQADGLHAQGMNQGKAHDKAVQGKDGLGNTAVY